MCPKKFLDMKVPLLLLLLVSFLRQKVQGKLLSTAGTHTLLKGLVIMYLLPTLCQFTFQLI